MTITELPAHEPDSPEVTDRGGRWMPSRAGVLNVWRYYDEVFEFHHGRLLLRGPNGTGKSKALELLLPYLLDASLRPHRLSTFGSGERTMWWNLMGEGATGATRVGYVWLEFTRLGEEGREWFCCGARLQASKHGKTPGADYFTTARRIGEDDLRLCDDSGAPLSRAALAEQLGAEGTVHSNAGEYRTEVRQRLFPELTEQRYDALITALLQLRQPKLSERLDPALLSNLLSRALPPLGQSEISELAEGFERLDRQREQLRELDAEVEAAQNIAARQGTYARRVLRANAATLISATSELQNLSEAARTSEENYQQAVRHNDEAEQRKQTLDNRVREMETRVAALREREEYKEGAKLDELRQDTERARRGAEREREQATRKQETAEADARHLEQARTAQQASDEALTAARAEAERAAHHADLDTAHAEVASALESGTQATAILRAAVRSRTEQISGVRTGIDEHEAALRRRSEAEQELENARGKLSEAAAERTARAASYDSAVEAHAERLRGWAGSTVELVFDNVEDLAAAAESESAVLRLVDPVSHAATRAITGAETTVTTQRASAEQERDELTQRLDDLRSETDLPPPPPPNRTAERSELDGEPLWKLVSFAENVTEHAKAGLEAALQASGLLDAFVPSSGTIEIAEHDTFLDPDSLEVAPTGSLADVLTAEQDSSVPAERIRRLLAGIGHGESLPSGNIAVADDGHWRIAGAYGSWAKTEVEHIGAAARERARQRRIDECLERVEEVDSTLATLDERLRSLERRRARLEDELAARPAHTEVDEARRGWEAAEARVGATDAVVRDAAEKVTERAEAADAALRELSALADQHGLPAEREKLDVLAEAVRNFDDLGQHWLGKHDEVSRARQHTDTMAEYAERSAAEAAERAEAADTAEAAARDSLERLQTLEDTIGADYREVLAEISSCRQRRDEARHSAGEEERTLRELQNTIGSLNERRGNDARRRDEAAEVRDTATARFRHLATGNLPADAGGELELATTDGVRATLEAARAVAAQWPDIPHAERNIADALHRLSEAVHDCRDTLSRRAELALEPEQDVHLFTASIDGVRISAAELVRTLRDEAERSRGDITERERELFDQTLTGDTRRHLADRIRQAGELVEEMNTRLQRVRTASKVTVRLVWQVDPELPAGTKAARELLLKDPVRLSDEERESLHRFFRERIEQARAENVAASWEQQLAQVFDYTAWHRFVVKIDRANGEGWQLLTKRLHGALSGGEKAIALHLPLFAAVAAHYQTVPRAPRLILLDEVFVGVDATNRGQVFELLSSLDLDLVLTSDHEWGMYSELDGIAVHQLITDSTDEAVTTVRFVWDGADLTAGDEQ